MMRRCSSRIINKGPELMSGTPTLFYLGLDLKLTSFLKELIKVRLFWSLLSIKLDGLKMLKMRRPILSFFSLVLGVLPNSAPKCVHQSTGVTKILLKESFELDLRQEIFDCLIFPTLVLVPTKADLTTKKQSCKRDGWCQRHRPYENDPCSSWKPFY